MAMAEFEAIEESLMTSSPSRSRRRSRSREGKRLTVGISLPLQAKAYYQLVNKALMKAFPTSCFYASNQKAQFYAIFLYFEALFESKVYQSNNSLEFKFQ